MGNQSQYEEYEINELNDNYDIGENTIREWGLHGYPVHLAKSSNLFKRVEPLITPAQLISRFLLGIPLPDAYKSDDVLKDRINIAANEFEMLIKTPLVAELYRDKLPYDAALYRSFIHLNAQHKPIQRLLSLQISSADGQSLYTVPGIWIEPANFHRGLINVIPLLSTFGSTAQTGGIIQSAGLIFLATLGQLTFCPSFFQITYTSGVARNENNIPLICNSLVGTLAAIDILSNLASLNVATSVSISQDGISQASSGPGTQIYKTRMDELIQKREKYSAEIRQVFSNKYFMGNI
jgi:hypothetical protein